MSSKLQASDSRTRSLPRHQSPVRDRLGDDDLTAIDCEAKQCVADSKGQQCRAVTKCRGAKRATTSSAPTGSGDNYRSRLFNEAKDCTQDCVLYLATKRSVPLVGYRKVGSSPTASAIRSYDEH